MPKHITKNDYENGAKLDRPIVWCGRSVNIYDWRFLDTHHAALSVCGSVAPCKDCVKEIIKTFQKEL